MADIAMNPAATGIDAAARRIQSTGSATFWGWVAISAFVAGFGSWAVTLPINGAVIAGGSIEVVGENLRIQHLEGGIVRQVLVTEGAIVQPGDPLVELDDTQARAALQRLEKQHVSLQAKLSRLVAERDLADSVVYSEFLVARAGMLDLADTLTENTREFETLKSRVASEVAILNQRTNALEEAIGGLRSRQTAISEQLDVITEESARKEELLGKGLTTRDEYTALVRAKADLIGQQGAIEAEIARSQTQIIETQEQINRVRTQAVEQAVTELSEVRDNLADIGERIAAARDVLERMVIRTPAYARIVRLEVNTPGQVLRPGEPIAVLLPRETDMLASVRLSPQDIDNVQPGQPARLRFSALNQRTTPQVDGEVVFVSPDRLVDEATREPYFQARVRIGDLPAAVTASQIYPGMPVEALITTDERTFAEYLVRPILDSMALAFREE